MATFRAFIALELPPTIANHITKIQIQYSNLLPNPKIRWLPNQNIHLTLKFLGDTEEAIAPEINQIINDLSVVSDRIFLDMKAIQLFPHANRARGIWINFYSAPQLLNLKKTLDEKLAFLGIPISKKNFYPHLTLARFKRGLRRSEIRHIHHEISKQPPNLLQSVNLDKLTLFQSDLQPGGAIYSKRFTCLLK